MDTGASLASQLYAFGFSALGGLACGILFDWYRIVRWLVRPGKALTFVGDLCFWAVAAASTFLLLLMGNWGEVRVYVFLGMALGLFLYFQLFHGVVVAATVLGLRLVGALLFGLAYLTGELLRLPFLVIRDMALWLGLHRLWRRLGRRPRWQVGVLSWLRPTPAGPPR